MGREFADRRSERRSRRSRYSSSDARHSEAAKRWSGAWARGSTAVADDNSFCRSRGESDDGTFSATGSPNLKPTSASVEEQPQTSGGTVALSRESLAIVAEAPGRHAAPRAYFYDYDDLLSDSDADDADETSQLKPQQQGEDCRSWAHRWALNIHDMTIALCPVCDGGYALFPAVWASAYRFGFFLAVILTAAALARVSCTGCSANVTGLGLLGEVLPCLWRELLWSGLIAALLPIALGNALLAMDAFPLLMQAELPDYGLWLGLPAPLAVLLPVLAFVPLAIMATCTSLLVGGAGFTTPIDAQFVAFDSMESNLVIGVALAVGAASSWTTLVRLSLTNEPDNILCV